VNRDTAVDTSPKESAKAGFDPRDQLAAVVGAVASGLGVLGFVTLAGGVVLWSRFQGMGLSPDHSLALVPKSELVATGVEFLVPALLLSVGLVAIVMPIGWAIDSFKLFERIKKHELDRHKLLRRVKPIAWLKEKLQPERLPPSRWLVAPVLLGLVELSYASAALANTIPVGPFLILLLVAGLGALVASLCARFGTAVFCLVAFLAVGSFAIARVYELTSHDLKVQPMAYVRSQPGEATRVEIGYFVAETSDRILFASWPQDPQNELREFPRRETDDLEIGALVRPGRAKVNAARFAYNLCLRLLVLKPASQQPSGEPVCSAEYRDELKKTAKLPEHP
jgi:hypothetical protein